MRPGLVLPWDPKEGTIKGLKAKILSGAYLGIYQVSFHDSKTVRKVPSTEIFIPVGEWNGHDEDAKTVNITIRDTEAVAYLVVWLGLPVLPISMEIHLKNRTTTTRKDANKLDDA